MNDTHDMEREGEVEGPRRVRKLQGPTLRRYRLAVKLLEHVQTRHAGIPPMDVLSREIARRDPDGRGLDRKYLKKAYRKVFGKAIRFVKNGAPYVPTTLHDFPEEAPHETFDGFNGYRPSREAARPTPTPQPDWRGSEGKTKGWENDKAEPLQAILAALRGQRTAWGKLANDVEKLRVEVGALSDLIVKVLSDREAEKTTAATPPREEVPDGSETAEQH